MSALGGKKDFDILVVSTPSTPPLVMCLQLKDAYETLPVLLKDKLYQTLNSSKGENNEDLPQSAGWVN